MDILVTGDDQIVARDVTIKEVMALLIQERMKTAALMRMLQEATNDVTKEGSDG